jgi:Transposase and inactivated derivatives
MQVAFMPTIQELQAEITALKAQATKRDEDIQKLQKLNDWYAQQLKLNRKKMFGSSSEKGEYAGMEQLNFFNEAEAERGVLNPEPTVETITYKRNKKKGSREKLLEQLPVEVIEYTLPENEQNCPKCGNALHVMSKEIRKELKIVPAKVSVIEHVSYVYACRNCDKNDVETPIITASAPKALIAKSLVSPSVMAYIMNQKFVNAMPLYRQEQELKRMGVLLSRQTLSNWMIKGSSLLKPLMDTMKAELLKKDILHADETTLEVLCEPDRPAQTNSYMWVYRTSGCDIPIVLYDYQQGRSGRFAKKYLQGFKGYLHTDGWGGYHQLQPEVTLCGCWAHARRKFNEALEVCTDKSSDSPEALGLSYCQKLFNIEKMAEGKLYDERYDIRQEQSTSVIEEFYAWIEKQQDKTLPQSLLGKALQYAQNQKKHLLSFLKDGRIELSNNRAERSIKPFVIGRKNWLFCNTPGGAKSSALLYSLVETAKENNLNPYEYLNFVFEQIQANPAANLSDLLPWSDKIRQSCRIKN